MAAHNTYFIARSAFVLVMLLCTRTADAQSDQHYTMFLYNKLLYNPAYAGSKDITSATGDYRTQWTGINGAPKTLNATIDGPVGNYMLPFRKVATGLTIANEKIGVENNTNIMGYYAYRIRIENSTLSFGLRAGVKMYTARYSQLNLSQPNDLTFSRDVVRAVLPNTGAGIYWYRDNAYAGFSVPNLLQNYYDKKEKPNPKAKEVRGYYFSGGYVFPVSEDINVEPQLLTRYAGNRLYRLPFNCDFNVTGIFYERFIAGLTYRTDKSFEFIVHLQATKNINIGYSYDYLLSELSAYDRSTHEIVIGYDFIRDNSKYLTPRIIRAF